VNIILVLIKIILMRLFLQMAIVVVLTSSCYTAKSLNRTIKNQDREIISSDISGIYELNETNGNRNLYNLLKSNTSFDYEMTFVDSTIVKLKLIDSTAIVVSLIKDDFEIESFELKGEIIDNGFLTHRLKKIYPFFPVFYIHWETRMLLGRDTQDQLLISYGRQSSGMIFFYGAGGGYNRLYCFDRIE